MSRRKQVLNIADNRVQTDEIISDLSLTKPNIRF